MSGDACVNIGTIVVRRPDEEMGWSEVVNDCAVNEASKITRRPSRWDFEAHLTSAF